VNFASPQKRTINRHPSTVPSRSVVSVIRA
jgi:hypothetical protein